MRRIIFISLFMTTLPELQAQTESWEISGIYQSVPLKVFLDETEQKFPVHFFYDETAITGILVTANFNQIPLTKCLGTILDGVLTHCYQLDKNHFIIYTGVALNRLFPSGEAKNEVRETVPTAEKISREKLDQLQYRILSIGTPGLSSSKTATISGYVRDFESGDPVTGANIYILEIKKGVSTDKNGYYTLTLPKGNHILNCSCIGMEPARRIVNLYSDGKLDIEMITRVNLLKDISILATGEGNLSRIEMGLEKIDIITLKSIPSLLGDPNIMKSVLTMPGVQAVGEGTSGFNVRGGKTDQNLVLIDQAPLYYPSHFFGNFSAVNSEIIDNAVLYKASMPVKYGGRISSVFEINTREGNKEKIAGAGGISPISAHFHIEGPLTKKSTFLASFRSTYSNWVLNLIKVRELYKSKANFYDAQIKTNLYLNENNSLAINVYNSNDHFQLQSDSVYSYKNAVASLSWKHTFNQNLKSETSVLYSGFSYGIANENSINQSFRLTHSLQNAGLKSNLEYSVKPEVKFNAGVDFSHYAVNPGERKVPESSAILPIYADDEKALEFGVYTGSEYSLTPGLKINGGVRLSGMFAFGDGKRFIYAEGMPRDEDYITDTLYTTKNSVEATYLNPEFRLSANYMINPNSSLKMSYNKTAQYIHMLSNTTAISPSDTWKLSDKYLSPQTGQQVSLGYFRNFKSDMIQTSVEGFYKKMKNIKEYKAGANLLLNDHIETEVLDGLGKSYGVELSVEKKSGRFYGQLNYTWSRTLIRTVSEFEEELINDGEYFPANYDKPHNLNVLANVKLLRRLIFSASLNYSTGRPITYPVAQYKLGDQVFLHYSRYNQYRIPDYFRTDLSVTIEGNLKSNKLIHGTLTFSLYNLTGRKNAYSVYFRSEGSKVEAYKLSIFGTAIPTVTYNFRF